MILRTMDLGAVKNGDGKMASFHRMFGRVGRWSGYATTGAYICSASIGRLLVKGSAPLQTYSIFHPPHQEP
jgi:hypothetical protein